MQDNIYLWVGKHMENGLPTIRWSTCMLLFECVVTRLRTHCLKFNFAFCNWFVLNCPMLRKFKKRLSESCACVPAWHRSKTFTHLLTCLVRSLESRWRSLKYTSDLQILAKSPIYINQMCECDIEKP